MTEKIPLSIDSETLEQVMRRSDGNRSGAIAITLKRHFDLMARYRLELADMFSADECGLIIDSLNGVWLGDDSNIRFLVANIEDAIKTDRLDTKWSVDGRSLIDRLKSLSVGHMYAIADAVALWWSGSHSSTREYGDLFK